MAGLTTELIAEETVGPDDRRVRPAAPGLRRQLRSDHLADVGTGRGFPEQVADVIAYLAEERASMITGSILQLR